MMVDLKMLSKQRGTTLTRQHKTSVVIIGGGFAGCLLAWKLYHSKSKSNGLRLGYPENFILLEREENLGGRMPLELTPKNSQIFEAVPGTFQETQLAFSFPTLTEAPTGGEHFSDEHKIIFEHLGLRINSAFSFPGATGVPEENSVITARKNGSDTLIFLLTKEGTGYSLEKLGRNDVEKLKEEIINSTLVLENSCLVSEVDPTWKQQQLHSEVKVDDGEFVFLNGHESYSFFVNPIYHVATALKLHNDVWLNTTVTKVRYRGQFYQVTCETNRSREITNEIKTHQTQIISDAVVFALPPWQLLGVEIESDDPSFPINAIKTLSQITTRPLVFKFLVSGVIDRTMFFSSNIKEFKVLFRSDLTRDFHQFVFWPKWADSDFIATGAVTLLDPTNQALKIEMVRSVLAFLHQIGVQEPRLTLITTPELSGGSYPIYRPSDLPDDVMLQCLKNLAKFNCFFVGDAYDPKNFAHMAAAASTVNQVFHKLIEL